MSRLIVILLISLTFETAGVILLSKGLRNLQPPDAYTTNELWLLFLRAAQDPNILLGVLFEAVFFAGLLTMMSKADVSFVWPMTSLTFVFATLAAKFYLEETISTVRWTGVILIVFGAGLITYSERRRQQRGSHSQQSVRV